MSVSRKSDYDYIHYDDDDFYDNGGDFGLGRMKINPVCNEVNFVRGDQGKLSIRDAGSERSEDWPIRGFKPHPKSAPCKKDRDLIALATFGREGRPLQDNYALFGFKEPKHLEQHAGKCNPDTQHARLHRELYGKCPEDENKLAAVGFAFKSKEGDFAFNSNTFNDNTKKYLDKAKYRLKNTRTAEHTVQREIRKATEQWREDNCPTENWSYTPKTTEQAGKNKKR